MPSHTSSMALLLTVLLLVVGVWRENWEEGSEEERGLWLRLLFLLQVAAAAAVVVAIDEDDSIWFGGR